MDQFSALLLQNDIRGPDKNLCFVNSTLQILRVVPEFRQRLFGNHFQVLLKNILEKEGTGYSVSASPVRRLLGKSILQYASNAQQDAAEFLQHLFVEVDVSCRKLFELKFRKDSKFFHGTALGPCPFCQRFPNSKIDKLDIVVLSNVVETQRRVSLSCLLDDYFVAPSLETEGQRCSHCCPHGDSSNHKEDKRCKKRPYQVSKVITHYPPYL